MYVCVFVALIKDTFQMTSSCNMHRYAHTHVQLNASSHTERNVSHETRLTAGRAPGSLTSTVTRFFMATRMTPMQL